MTRYLTALLFSAAVAAPVFAQPPQQNFVPPAPISGARPPWVEEAVRQKLEPPPSPPRFAFPAAPTHIPLPAGKPLVGYYIWDGVLVGADGRYPFDTGDFLLGGFQGTTRTWGTYTIDLPNPTDVDPHNQAVPYKYCRGLFSSCGGGCCSGAKGCAKP
jgi:hypothetical protein